MLLFIFPPSNAQTGLSRSFPRISQHAISNPENAPITERSGLCVKPDEKVRLNTNSIFSGD